MITKEEMELLLEHFETVSIPEKLNLFVEKLKLIVEELKIKEKAQEDLNKINKEMQELINPNKEK